MREAAAIWVALCMLAAVVTITIVFTLRVQNHENDALHTIICSIERFDVNSRKLTNAQKRQSVKFWTNELRDAHLNSCGTG